MVQVLKEGWNWPRSGTVSPWLVISLLFTAALINYIDRGNLSIAAPALMKSLHCSPAAMGALLSAFFWSYSLLQIPAGYLVDRYGLKWTYTGAFLIWSLASAAIAGCSTFSQVLLLRILLGAAESVVTPASLAFIKRAFRPAQQGLATGIITAGMIIGPALGSLLGSALLQQFGWRLLFLFTGLGGCIWLLPWLLIAPNAGAHPAENESVDSVSRAQRSFVPPIPANLIGALTAGSFFYGYYWYFCLSWLPSYLVMRRGLSLMAMGGFTGVPLIAMALVTLLSARIADRIISKGRPAVATRRWFVCLGFTLGSVIIFLPAVSSHAAVFATLTASLMGLGVASANFWTLSQTLADSRVVGRVIAYQNMIANFAGILAPMLTGWIVATSRNGFDNAIVVSGFSLWVAAASFVFLKAKAHSRWLRIETGPMRPLGSIQGCQPPP